MYYSAVYEGCEDKVKSVGLGSVCKQLLGQEVCKAERMSNWEKRPLRLAQLHYGYLDAYCMIPAIKVLIQKAKASGDLKRSFETQVKANSLGQAAEQKKREDP